MRGRDQGKSGGLGDWKSAGRDFTSAALSKVVFAITQKSTFPLTSSGSSKSFLAATAGSVGWDTNKMEGGAPACVCEQELCA
jgi:hypothetical protein